MFELNAEEQQLIDTFRDLGSSALATFFDDHREELKRLIRLRLDRRIARRVDESDVLQEAYVESCNRLPAYVENPQIPPMAWIRRLARQVVVRIHREHFDTQKRDLRRETHGTPTVPMDLFELSAAITPPDAKYERGELQQNVARIMQSMTPQEREILVLVHAEELTIREAAAEIGINLEAAKKRYRRALIRLRDLTNYLAGSQSGPMTVSL